MSYLKICIAILVSSVSGGGAFGLVMRTVFISEFMNESLKRFLTSFPAKLQEKKCTQKDVNSVHELRISLLELNKTNQQKGKSLREGTRISDPFFCSPRNPKYIFGEGELRFWALVCFVRTNIKLGG